MLLTASRSRFLRLPILAVSALVFAGCRGSVPEQALSRPLPAVTPVAPQLERGTWTYHPPLDRRTYVLEQHAVLTISQDTTTRVDSVRSHAEVAFAMAAATGRVTGSLNVFRVEGSPRVPSTPTGLVVPFAFTADYPVDRRQLVFSNTDATTPCASRGIAVAQSLRDLWFRPPDTLRLGTAWEDSASYVVCRDGVPLHAIVQRTFRIASAEQRAGRFALLVIRRSHTALEAETRLLGESLSVRGSGTGDLSYELDPANGEILSAHGVSVLDLVVRGRLREQHVHQVAETRVAGGA